MKKTQRKTKKIRQRKIPIMIHLTKMMIKRMKMRRIQRMKIRRKVILFSQVFRKRRSRKSLAII